MEKLQTQEQIAARYPSIFYERLRYLGDPQQYIVVDDVTNNPEESFISSFCNSKVEVQGMGKLVNELTPRLTALLTQYDPQHTLFIYPGGGGWKFKRALPPEISMNYASVNIDISRTKNPLTGKREPYMTEDEQDKLSLSLQQAQTVLICDDAINEGKTLRYIKEMGQTTATWIAVAPILFAPYGSTRNSPSSIEEFDAIFATELLDGVEKPVPLNFLSSLLKRNIMEDPGIRKYLFGNCISRARAMSLLQGLLDLQSTV